MKPKLLICGATGFIGRNLVEYFAKIDRYEVIAVYNKRPPYSIAGVQWRKADLTDPEQVAAVMQEIDVVIQAAATTSGSKDIVSRPYIHVTDNAVMNSLIFREAFEKKIHQVIFFSCTVMLQSENFAQSESQFDISMPIHPRYFGVGWTKLYIEKMCEFYAGIGNTKFTAIRHSNIYGPHDKFDLERSHVFGATITKVLTAKDRITVWGTGEESRDLLYVDDLSRFVDSALQHQKQNFGLYNCGYGQAIKIKDLVEKIIRISQKEITIEHDLSQPTINTSLFLDCSKAKQDFGWSPAVDLDQGIQLTIEWWRNHVK